MHYSADPSGLIRTKISRLLDPDHPIRVNLLHHLLP
ncbi:hypothetical protein YPF_0922 [Yersinia pestis biovar Orientalis str. India 195]|nr:hypothetical protein YPF_0922 [Yersinia pestis biovar Orientalis str. India 195]EEO91331.1 hypothetical protein YPS_1558 [Yersinia pestis Pestoides A]